MNETMPEEKMLPLFKLLSSPYFRLLTFEVGNYVTCQNYDQDILVLSQVNYIGLL